MILLGASVALLVVIARAIDRFAAVDDETRAAKATRMLLWAFATVVIVQAALGAVGLLTPLATLLVLASLAAVSLRIVRSRPRAHEPRTVLPARSELTGDTVLTAILAMFIVLLFLARLWSGVNKTTFLYDTLSYHLHVPATWMHDRRLSIVPAVFGDPSPAYAPSNGELWFLFLMAPLRSDYLAGVGQLPFAALAVCAIATAVRDQKGSRGAALAAAIVFLLIPEIWTQMPTAMTDLAFAACLLAANAFTLRLWTASVPRRADLFAAATAMGLAVGMKYAAAPLALPFLTLAAGAWLRRRPRDWRAAAPALAIVLATGGFWYVRNAVLTGNPVYPVAVPGLHLPALYGRAEMRAWDYHVPVGDVRELGSMLIAAGIGFCFAFALAVARHWRRPEAVLSIGLLAIFWFVVPYQESRFLFAVFGVGAVLLGRATLDSDHFKGALAIAFVGAFVEWHTAERLLVLVGSVLASAVVAGVAKRLPDLDRRLLPWAAAGGAALLFAVLASGAANHADAAAPYTVGDETAADWAWFRANVHDARVAYTGTNVGFPLAGRRLSNDVRYVNVAGAPGDVLHHFGPPGDGTGEPAPYRRSAQADVWLSNLRAARTQILYVAALYPGVRRNVSADDDGFPVERAWADARPDSFYLLHASPTARVYSVNLR